MNIRRFLPLTALGLSWVFLGAKGCEVEVAFDPLHSETPLPFPTDLFHDGERIHFTGDLHTKNLRLDYPDLVNRLGIDDLDFSGSVTPEALSRNDGFSTSGRIVIGLNDPSKSRVDATSVEGSLYLLGPQEDGLWDAVEVEVGLDGFGQKLSRRRRVDLLYLEPFRPLEPATTYIVVVRGGEDGLRDERGNPLVASAIFEAVKNGETPEGYETFADQYHQFIRPALDSAGIPENEVLLAFSFTTRSEPSLFSDLQAIRKTLYPESGPKPDFFDTEICRPPEELQGIEDCNGKTPPRSDNDRCYCEQMQLSQDLQGVPHDQFDYHVGLYTSQNFQDEEGHFGETPVLQGKHRISFLLTIPKGAKENEKIPLIIYQHPSSIRKERLLLLANRMAEHGFAMIGIDAIEHNFRNSQNVRNPTIFVDDLITLLQTLTDFHDVEDLERMADNFRQTIVDLFHLVRIVQREEELPEKLEGVAGFSNIFFIGDSVGSFLGVPFVTLEPSIDAAAFWVVGAKFTEVLRESTDLGFQDGMFNAVFKLLAEVDDPVRVSNFVEAIAAGQVLMDRVEPSNFGRFLTRGRKVDGTSALRNVLFFQSEPDGRISHGNYAELARAMEIPIVGEVIDPLPGVESIPDYPYTGEEVTAAIQQYDTITIPEESPDAIPSDHNALIRSIEAQCQAIAFFNSYMEEGISTIVPPGEGCE